MTPRTTLAVLLLATSLPLFITPIVAVEGAPSTPASSRERILLDAGWRFAIGHPSDPARDFGHATGFFSYLAKTGFGDGAAAAAFDDRGWRELDLPHDWAVEAPFDANASHSHGYKAVGPRFPERSVGWYRRHFSVPGSDLGRRIRLEFDGVYRDARVFVNGFFVGQEPSGYLPVSYDISDYLDYGGDNVIAVRVDATMEEGWYYEGAGIYRHVWLSKTAPLHVAREGTWVTTNVADDHASATIKIETVLTNEGRETAAGFVIEQTILGPDGSVVTRTASQPTTLAPGGKETRHDAIRVSQPQLWSIETPVMHTLVTTIRSGDGATLIDRYETPFGIRTIRFDPDAGFFLNGARVEIKGTNNHQDHAGVGVAVPDALQVWRIRALKAMGSNTYRTSHHPPTPELLDACDRLGMLVIDENRLQGINDYHLGQLERMIRRDRNHPSVILWSLGNEEWGIESNIKGARITSTMQDFARRIDPTRLTTVAISGGWGGTSTTVLVAGVNYIGQAHPDEQHAQYPWQVILGTEETTTQQTRGVYFDDRARCHLAPLEDGSSKGNAEIGWKYYAARPHFAGVCYWTGFDYRGEPTPFGWPAVSSQFGILDTCGFPKDGFYHLKSWWQDEPVLHIFPHWNWAGRERQKIEVRAHSNCDEVELSLNGTLLGRKRMPPNGHLAWQVPYLPGALVARGFRGGDVVLTTRVETTGPAAALALEADRPALAADGRDVSVIAISTRDAQGRAVPTASNKVSLSIRGPGRILGVGNGDPACHEPDVFVPAVEARYLGTWTPPEAYLTEGDLVFEATFEAPALAEGASATLLLNALGPQQTVTLNGKPLFTNAAPDQSRAEVPLASLTLKRAGNVLRISTPRFADYGARDRMRQAYPATLRIDTPAPAWQRSLFNGLAQVIVQSTGEPGMITLTATSDGLAPASVEIQTGPLN